MFVALGAVLTVQRGTRNYCLLSALSSHTSHISGLAAREEFQSEGHASQLREQIRKRYRTVGLGYGGHLKNEWPVLWLPNY